MGDACGRTYELVAAGAQAVVLRSDRDQTARDLCVSLGLSKRVQGRLFGGGALVRGYGGPLEPFVVASWDSGAHGPANPSVDKGVQAVRAPGSAVPLGPASEVGAGEYVTLHLMRQPVNTPATAQGARVLWYDRFLAVAEKPAGLLVHGDGSGADTLTAHMQAGLSRAARAGRWDAMPVAQAVNRLDVDTSGLVLFSLTEEFQPALDALVGGRGDVRARKRYLAVVEGRFPRGRCVIDAPVARDRHDARRMRVGATGKPSRTQVSCLAHGRGVSLVGCELQTGRRHQIRVHLAHMGHPIVGDVLYGSGNRGGLMLHAGALELAHPVSGQHILLYTEWPHRFSAVFSPRDLDWSILNPYCQADGGRGPYG